MSALEIFDFSKFSLAQVINSELLPAAFGGVLINELIIGGNSFKAFLSNYQFQ